MIHDALTCQVGPTMALWFFRKHLRQRTAREFSILRPEMTLDTSLSEAFFVHVKKENTKGYKRRMFDCQFHGAM